MNITTTPAKRINPSGRQWGLVARAVSACMLLVLVSGGLALTARPARAENASLTIVRQDGLNAAYDAYLLFRATVTADDLALDVTWSSDEMRRSVLAVLETYGYEDWFAATYPHGSSRDSARAAAEFISDVLEGTSATPTTGDRARHRSTRSALSNDLARALTGNDTLVPQTAWSNEPFVGSQGYWLFFSHEDEQGCPGTAPLFALMGGSTEQITEKASTATLDMEVREDADGTWGKTSDAQRGQLVSHRIVVVLPRNLEAYDRYHCRITCTLPEGMTLHVPQNATCTEALAVSIGNYSVDTSVAPLTATYEANVLSVDFADLIDPAWDACDLANHATVCIGFDTLLNDAAKIGAAGNLCTAQLTSTSDPVRGRETTIAPVSTVVFCYGIEVLKVDDQQGTALAGAAFTLAECDREGTATQSYVQADGSLGPQPHQFSCDDQGVLRIACLDEGRYLLRETTAPQGYALPAKGIELQIDAERVDESLSLGRVTVSIASGNAEVAAIDEASGTATIRVLNTREASPAAHVDTDRGSAQDSARRLAQTGVGLLSFALVGIGLALRHLGTYPLPSEGQRHRGKSQLRTRKRRT